jgi:hypothetical protein
MLFAPWLTTLSWISLSVGFACAILIFLDVRRHPQQMTVMSVVWPITGLYSGPIGLAAYFSIGRLSTREAVEQAKRRGQPPPGRRKPFWQTAGVGATHCGAGCSLGDLVAEWALVLAPFTLFGSPVAASWTLDFVVAFSFGIAFQYFAIVPMRKLPVGAGILAAIKADALSLTAWQVGMYGFMALMMFVVFGHEIPKTTPVFWFLMQLAMLAGFVTAYPVNWWLIRAGLKEKM